MPARKKKNIPTQKKIRDTIWSIGKKGPPRPETDHIALLMVHPHQGHVYWNLNEQSLDTLRKDLGSRAEYAAFTVRIYDVTDVIFDGLNAHTFFDLNVHDHSGNYYFTVERTARNMLAEAGLRCPDGSFHPAARSNTMFFDRDRPSGNYHPAGLFVGSSPGRTFPVDNIFEAPVYERMNRELEGIDRKGPLRVAQVFLDTGRQNDPENPLLALVRNISGEIERFGADVHTVTGRLTPSRGGKKRTIIERVDTASRTLYRHLSAAHSKTPFHIVHCHDWYSAKAGLTASRKLKVPMVLTLHSTECERAGGTVSDPLSSRICGVEEKAVQGAALVIVPNASARREVIDRYGAEPGRVAEIPHKTAGASQGGSESPDIRRWFGLNGDEPIVLFAGEVSHAAGADILVDALPVVCRNYGRAQFVFAGDGPLRGELEARSRHMGIGHRCRFLGDISSKNFQSLLTASDFVVIPARTWQDEGLAQLAVSAGKPVLTTQQAGIGCVKHGENGLVTFDNPGSIVWGLQELLSGSLNQSMLRVVARKKAGGVLSTESIAALHYMHYEIILKHRGAPHNV